MNPRWGILLSLILLFFSANLFAQDTYSLKYKFEKGKTYFYRMTNDNEVNQSVMGQEINLKSRSILKMRMEIADVANENIEIITSMDSVEFKSDNPMVGDAAGEAAKSIIGKKTKMIYDKFGKIVKKIEIDKFSTPMNLSATGSSEGLFRLSSKPVKIGESWQNIDTMKIAPGGEGSGNMLFIITSDLKLEGKEVYENIECLKISYSQVVKIEGSMSTQGNSVIINGTGKGIGYCLFDDKNGNFTKNIVNVDMNTTISLPEQNIEMPMTQNTKTSILMVK